MTGAGVSGSTILFNVNTASEAVTGEPSSQTASGRSWNVKVLPSPETS